MLRRVRRTLDQHRTSVYFARDDPNELCRNGPGSVHRVRRNLRALRPAATNTIAADAPDLRHHPDRRSPRAPVRPARPTSRSAVVHRPLHDRVPARPARPGRRRRLGTVSRAGAEHWMDTAIEATEAPHLIREGGRGGRSNRVPVQRSGSSPRARRPTSSEVTVTFWTEPGDASSTASTSCSAARALPPRLEASPAAAPLRSPRMAPRSSGSGSVARTRSRLSRADGCPLNMLPPAMRRRIPTLALLALAGLVLAALADRLRFRGRDRRSAEGEPIEIAGLSYNIQITRFLNPDDTEDAEYLVGQPPAKPGTSLPRRLHGRSPTTATSRGPRRPTSPSSTRSTTSTTPSRARARTRSRSAPRWRPRANCRPRLRPPQTGPNQGSLLIFPVSDDVSDNRPLRLEIQTYDGSGEVILDI